jgi:hypothetical protein
VNLKAGTFLKPNFLHAFYRHDVNKVNALLTGKARNCLYVKLPWSGGHSTSLVSISVLDALHFTSNNLYAAWILGTLKLINLFPAKLAFSGWSEIKFEICGLPSSGACGCCPIGRVHLCILELFYLYMHWQCAKNQNLKEHIMPKLQSTAAERNDVKRAKNRGQSANSAISF